MILALSTWAGSNAKLVIQERLEPDTSGVTFDALLQIRKRIMDVVAKIYDPDIGSLGDDDSEESSGSPGEWRPGYTFRSDYEHLLRYFKFCLPLQRHILGRWLHQIPNQDCRDGKASRGL